MKVKSTMPKGGRQSQNQREGRRGSIEIGRLDIPGQKRPPMSARNKRRLGKKTVQYAGQEFVIDYRKDRAK